MLATDRRAIRADALAGTLASDLTPDQPSLFSKLFRLAPLKSDGRCPFKTLQSNVGLSPRIPSRRVGETEALLVSQRSYTRRRRARTVCPLRLPYALVLTTYRRIHNGSIHLYSF